MDGIHGFHPRLPSPAGSEGAGTVVETGTDVSLAAVGDRVLVLPLGAAGALAGGTRRRRTDGSG
ncbi:alcohol dehydrogenase catalytic domain-containing protein [Streptomyces sp. AHA2]